LLQLGARYSKSHRVTPIGRPLLQIAPRYSNWASVPPNRTALLQLSTRYSKSYRLAPIRSLLLQARFTWKSIELIEKEKAEPESVLLFLNLPTGNQSIR